MTSTRPTVSTTSLVAGVALGCVLSAVVLAFESRRQLDAPCPYTVQEDCLDDFAARRDLSNLMEFGATTLGALGAGGLAILWVRSRTAKPSS